MFKGKWKKLVTLGMALFLAFTLAGCEEDDYVSDEEQLIVSEVNEKEGSLAEPQGDVEKEREADEDGNKTGHLVKNENSNVVDGPKEGQLAKKEDEEPSEEELIEEVSEETQEEEILEEEVSEAEPLEEVIANIDQKEANDYFIPNVVVDIEGFVERNAQAIPQKNYDCYYYYYYDYNHDGAVDILLDLVYNDGLNQVVVPVSYDYAEKKALIHPYTELNYNVNDDEAERHYCYEYQGYFSTVTISGDLGEGVITVNSLDNGGNFSQSVTLKGDENNLDSLGFVYLEKYTSGEFTPLYMEE